MLLKPNHSLYPHIVDPSQFSFHPGTKFYANARIDFCDLAINIQLSIKGLTGKFYDIDFLNPVEESLWNYCGIYSRKDQAEFWFVENSEVSIKMSDDMTSIIFRFRIHPFHSETVRVSRLQFSFQDYFLATPSMVSA